MRSRMHVLVLVAIGFLASPSVGLAGMPSFSLSDMARIRVQTMSFFLMGLLLSSAAIKLIWNRLAKDFLILPRLSYPKALGVVALWGLLFVLVLTMISGARELLTPGAWEKQGVTYRLKEQPVVAPATPREPSEMARRQKLDELRFALWDYALSHNSRFPPDASSSAIPKERWEVPDPSGLRYIYLGGQVSKEGMKPLAFEPEIFGEERLVLLTSGQIVQLKSDDLSRLLPQGKH